MQQRQSGFKDPRSRKRIESTTTTKNTHADEKTYTELGRAVGLVAGMGGKEFRDGEQIFVETGDGWERRQIDLKAVSSTFSAVNTPKHQHVPDGVVHLGDQDAISQGELVADAVLA